MNFGIKNREEYTIAVLLGRFFNLNEQQSIILFYLPVRSVMRNIDLFALEGQPKYTKFSTLSQLYNYIVYDSPPNNSSAGWLKYSILNLFNVIILSIIRPRKVFIWNRASITTVLKMLLMKRVFVLKMVAFHGSRVEKDLYLREQLCKYLVAAKTKYNADQISILLDVLPVSIIEDRYRYGKKYNNLSLGSLITKLDFTNEEFLFFLTKIRENTNIEIKIYQHGGYYGTLVENEMESLELMISDKFYYLASSKKYLLNDQRYEVLKFYNVDVFSSWFIDKQKLDASDPDVDLLFIGSNFTERVLLDQSIPYGETLAVYYEMVRKLIDSKNELRRTYRVVGTQADKLLYQMRLNPEKLSLESSGKLVRSLRRCRLVVNLYPGTVFLECLSRNIPMVLVENDFIKFEINKDLIKELREEGIIISPDEFTSSFNIDAFITNWYATRVQKIISAAASHYCPRNSIWSSSLWD